jgi:hypothetical protein
MRVSSLADRRSEMNPQSQPEDNQKTRQVSLSGYDLINSPRLNKGTAFSDLERDIFGLHGLLPPHVGNLDEQIERRMRALAEHATPFNKHSFLRDLQDTNETRSLSWRGLRAVATTRWPASRAACANALPKPRELPVMSQTFDPVCIA